MRTRGLSTGLLALLLIFGVAVAVLFTASTDDHGTTPGARRPDQATLQASVVNDRKYLFNGSLSFVSHVETEVGDPVTYVVRLTAVTPADDKPPHASPSPSTPASASEPPTPETRSFQVGGVEGAALTSGSDRVKVVPLSDSTTKQIIAAPRDTALWQWSVTPSEPGEYRLALAVTTYQGESDRALDTLTPPITLHLTVHDTWAHRGNALKGWLIGLGAVALALTAVLALRTPLTECAQARAEARRQRDQQNGDGYL
ncbi:hypothetical protein [Streptomyces sp. V3I7]|uniref:hypothetical protein n=1 Tax=Streptomyces sp. V3I7 TaxID=3042278 RepID=UPI00277FC70D|nr:hypothetical protein [Streptomyces sp. V3I7]MDQ0994077.1 hypothetical protein [Streptomyces sp. V3I7]